MKPLDINLLLREPLNEVEIHVADINFSFYHCRFNNLDLTVNRYFREGKLELVKELERLYLEHGYDVKLRKSYHTTGELLHDLRISVPKEEGV